MTTVPASTADARPVFSSRSVAWMLGVGTIAFLALVALATFQPELRGGQDGGNHALSRSAIGFYGLTRLLRDTGVPVVVSRGTIPRADGSRGLVIQTPGVGADLRRPRADDRRRARLIVLDKWRATNDPLHPGWVHQVGLEPLGAVARLAPYGGRRGEVRRRLGASGVSLARADATGPALSLDPIDRFQTVSRLNGAPILSDERGGTVLWRLPQNTFLLTDPDLLNNQGLRSRRNAVYAVALIDQLRGGGPVIFDVTVNGFTRSRSILRLALGPPFLGATLCALAAALLMGFHAAARFGPTPAAERALALGKRALVENSALLIRLARRQHRMGGRYAGLIRRAAIKGLALGREADPKAADAALDRLTGAGEPPFSALVAEAEAAQTEEQLMRAARALHRRKLEMTRERI